MLGDLALSARVRAALKEHDSTRDVNITIEAKDGKAHAQRHRPQCAGKRAKPPGSPAQSPASATSTTSCA